MSFPPPIPPIGFISGKPIDLFEYGNSFTARGISSASPVSTSINGLAPMLEAMSLGQFRVKNPLTQMVGINGQTSTYLLANFATNVTPNFSSFDWLLIWGACVNDFINSISAATSLANIQAMFALCKAAGKVLLLGTPYYTRTGSYAPNATQALTMAATNRLVSEWARDTPGVIYFDFWNDVIDPTQNLAASYGTLQDSDNLHPASLGVQTVAKRCLATCGQFLTAPTVTQGQLDTYDATNNPGGNAFSGLGTGAIALAGTSGTVGTGCSGHLPTGWQGVRNSGSDTIAFSTVAAAGGYGGLGSNQFSIGVTSSTGSQALAQCFPNCPAGFVGKLVEATLQMTIPNPSTGIADIGLALSPNYANGSYYGLRADLLSAAYWIPGNYLIRTPPFTIPTGSTTIQIQVYVTFLSGATTTILFSKPVLRIVNQ